MKTLLTLVFLMAASLVFSQTSNDLEISPISPSNKCPNGVLDLMINSGTGPYDVVWSWEFISGFYTVVNSVMNVNGNDGMEDLTDLPPGRYRVSVTDALCGVEQLEITLLQGLSGNDDARIISEKKCI